MKALILTYHRVAESKLDPWCLRVSPKNFFEHMDALRRVAHPIHLRDLVCAHTAGNIPEKAVAVTFDDGYVDNLTNAKPILEAHDVPATVFVCSGGAGRNKEFWWDQVDRALLQTDKLPKQLVLELAGNRRTWTFDDAKSEQDGSAVLTEAEASQAVALSNCMDIRKALRPLPVAVREKYMRQIREWAGIPDEPRPTHRTLSIGELVSLASGGLVDIGAHTVSHPLLTAHSREIQRYEITHSRTQLQEVIQRPVEHFAYPYGDYDQTAVDIVNEAGFASACTVVDRAVTKRSNVYELPRVSIQNWSGEEFLKIIQRRLSNSDVMSCDLEVGDQITLPLENFKTQTGDLQESVLECIPEKHAPGHCLYGPDYVISDSGMYRAVFAVTQVGSEVSGDAIFDVYENCRINRVLAETQVEGNGSFKPVALEFFAKKRYSIELRVYWRGKSRLKVSEIRLERWA
jgi:peptidoglycan/xylan/chitin deacetylase (PgdA/CDA1 family)